MKDQVINYTKKDEAGEEVAYQVIMSVPEDIDEMVQRWGADVAYQKAMAQIIIDARRRCYDAETAEAAQTSVSSWTPGVITRSAGGPSKKALLEMLKGVDLDTLKEFLAARKG